MADKHTSDQSSDSRRDDPVSAQPHPDDDVTSELSGLIARAFGSDRDNREDEPRVTGASLVARREADSEETLTPGSVLNERFEIVELVHSGGMSHVYKAIDRRRHASNAREAHVAVKMLRRTVSDRDEYRLLLEQEASKARALSHPNIIKIFDFDAHDGQFFLVMEWLDGESLNALLKRTGSEPLSPAFTRAVIDAVADALTHSHANNVIHADINPSNIFVTTTHDIKLLDFGVARFSDDEEESSEDLTAWVTPSYASPEVLSGLLPVARDDLFSLACVAYRCYTGTHPFNGKLPIVAKREGLDVSPIAALSESEWSVLKSSLAYARDERPESASVFLRHPMTDDGGARIGPSRAAWPWALLAAAALASVAAVGWWSQSGMSPEENTAPSAMQPDTASPPEADAPTETAAREPVSVVESLLALGRQAAAAEQLIAPANNNARDWYRQVLAIDAGNPEALAGLRAISNTFVEQARSAIDANDPRAAESALASAIETDAGNPAIPMLEELLVTQGDALLATARLAAANGDTEQAAQALAQAAQYAHIETAVIENLRTEFESLERQAALRDALAGVDAHIAAGRLLQPAGDNAYEALAPLRDTYGDEAELIAASRRLAERLLTGAALAAASSNLVEADSLVSAAASLGVLDQEVGRVQAVIAAAAASEAAAAAADDGVADPSAEVADASAAPLTADGVAETLDDGLAAETAPDSTSVSSVDTAAQTTAAATAVDSVPEDASSVEAPATDLVDDIAASPPDNGDLLADAVADTQIAAVAALPAATGRGRVTEAELPMTGNGSGSIADADAGRDSQPTAAPQPDAPIGATDVPAATTASASNPAGQSARSTAMQLRDLGLTSYSAPQYPQGAKRRGVSGHVDVAFNVTPDGRTAAIEILDAEPAGLFDRSVTRAIRKWRFEPREETIRGNITLRFEVE